MSGSQENSRSDARNAKVGSGTSLDLREMKWRILSRYLSEAEIESLRQPVAHFTTRKPAASTDAECVPR